MSRLPDEKIKKSLSAFELLPLHLDIETCNKDMSETITARSLKLGLTQLIECND